MPKIVICTTPIRPYPSGFPPFGSMAIIQAIRQSFDIDVDFFNIDYHRPTLDEVKEYFRSQQYDILGISAVVSTSYAYVKQLSLLVREVSPKTQIIVGGNLAASAEILHRKCRIDYCVIGSGEKIIVNLLNLLLNNDHSYASLHKVKGITFLEDGIFRFTGYGEKPSPAEIEDPDYGILEKDGSLDFFISSELEKNIMFFENNVATGKRMAIVVTTKGCVARCTFCHRWEKGFRVLPIDRLSQHLEYLVEKHNVGFIQIADENFGSDRQAAAAIASKLGNLGLIWGVSGVRTSTVTRESLAHWKANGCQSVLYGIESGSQKILDVMEKKTTVEQNINALKWAGEAGLNTIIQLVIAMPGENDKTIEETLEFLKIVAPYIKQWKDRTASDLISINYAHALPGTPLYEYGREHGFIGKDLDEEENYLLAISDTEAANDGHFVNMTNQPLLRVLTWRRILQAKLDDYHYRSMATGEVSMSIIEIIFYYVGIIANRVKNKILKKRGVYFPSELKRDSIKDSGYFNISAGMKFSPLLLNPLTKNFLFPIVACHVIITHMFRHPASAVRLIAEFCIAEFGPGREKNTAPMVSLRKVVKIFGNPDEAMTDLRKGR